MAVFPTSNLGMENILRDVHDPVAQTLRTNATATITGGTIEVVIDDTTDSIKIGDGSGDYLDINTDGSINVRSVQLFTKPFDSITATYPSPTQEIYKTRVGGISGTVQETATINYTDATKDFILNVART